MKKLSLVLIVIIFGGAFAAMAQNASYLDSVYQTQYQENVATGTENEASRVQALKDAIYENYNIDIVDDEAVNQWSEVWLTAVSEVLQALPEEFRQYTKVISLDPSYMQFEVKYNGYNDRDGEVQMGYGSIVPSNLYLNKFQSTFNRLPTASEKIARFKSILVRGMAYAFQQANPELASKWKQLFTPGDIDTKVFGPGQDINMVVAPGMTPAMVDMAFSIAMYCSSPSDLSSKSSERFNFIKEYVMGGKSVSGWGSTTIVDNGSSGTNGNNDNTGTVETPGSRQPPEIPDGDYIPLVTEVDVGTAAATIPQVQQHPPDELKNAIIEFFAEMPKFFSTCTEAIVYMPTTDTEAAFSSEGYVFITQNSWFAPHFIELTDESRAKRFKLYLLREMTKRFLFFHPEVSEKWQKSFVPNQMMFEVYVDICEAMCLYYANPDWLKDLNQERYNFIKTELMQGKEFN
ncbi:MAG: hypothetical protein Kow0029_01470 [Candidatus Rifleibacteriota bacterium]